MQTSIVHGGDILVNLWGSANFKFKVKLCTSRPNIGNTSPTSIWMSQPLGDRGKSSKLLMGYGRPISLAVSWMDPVLGLANVQIV